MYAVTRLVLSSLAIVLLGGCAATGQTPSDPYENSNRKVYGFNDAFDRATLKPVSKGYRKVIPRPARSGVTNFFDNLVTPRSSLNNFLQGKPGKGFSELARFIVNSSVGVGGLIDVASRTDIPRHYEDFSQTFAVWGLDSGPYIYLPFLGPHTLSDVLARPLDAAADPLNYYTVTSYKDKLRVLSIIDIRARLLAAEGFIEDSEDPYVAIREAYLQNREYNIYDGNPPTSDEDDALFDEFFEDDEDY